MNRSKSFCKKCFVPTCDNTSTNSRNKIFVHVSNNVKMQWCRMLNIEYNYLRRMYCCEDHLNLEEDLEDNQHHTRPKLKSTAKLRNFVVNDENNQSTSTGDLSSGNNSSFFKETSVLKELLLQPNIPVKQTTQKFSTNDTIPMATASTSTATTFVSRSLIKIHTATQCHPKMVDKSTLCRKRQKQQISKDLTTLVLEDKTSTSESPSLFGSTVETESEATVTRDKPDLVFRRQMLQQIYDKPKTYIGLPKQFLWLITYIVSQSKSNIKEIDIILTLFKLKQNDSVIRLCDEFQLSRITFSKLFHTSIEVLANFFQNLVYMPSPLQIKENLPLVFKIRYSNVQLILDAFEIEIEKPNDPVRQAQTWSEYKHCNTVKYLVGCTPNGFVSFISEGYGGRISDKALVEKSNLIDKLNFNSVIMADRGFKEIESMLVAKVLNFYALPVYMQQTNLPNKRL